MVKLQTLKSSLPILGTTGIRLLGNRAGATPHIRGRRWRKAGCTGGGFLTCVNCGREHASNEVDHDSSLERGRSNAPSNLVVRC